MKRQLNTLVPLILLMADAAEGSIIEDPLDTKCEDVDTSYPVLPAKLYDLRIKKAEVGPNAKTKEKSLNKGDEGYSETLSVQFETTEELKSEKGDPIAPGLVLSYYISVTPRAAHRGDDGKEKRAYTNDDIKKNVSALAKAAGTADQTVKSHIQNPSVLIGKIVRCNVGIKKAEGRYPRGNEINSFEVVK